MQNVYNFADFCIDFCKAPMCQIIFKYSSEVCVQCAYLGSLTSISVFVVKEFGDAEELDERDEDEEEDDEAVPVESESYVNLRKMMVKKHELRIDNLLQENSKLCQEFRRKRVRVDYCNEFQKYIVSLQANSYFLLLRW